MNREDFDFGYEKEDELPHAFYLFMWNPLTGRVSRIVARTRECEQKYLLPKYLESINPAVRYSLDKEDFQSGDWRHV